jgi:enoyl-CoA hydratase
MARDELLIERTGAITTLTFNRPEQRNALTAPMLALLRDSLRELAVDGETRVVLLRGAGERAFSSGYDFGALRELLDSGVAPSTTADPFEQTLAALRNCPLPTIAAIRGFAVGGGCALAAACDLRVAGEGARFGMPPAKLGLAYSDAGLRPFLELLGPARTKYLFYTGRMIGAREAHAIGLVDVVAADDAVEAAATILAQEIAANAPLSIQATKLILSELAAATPLRHSARADIEALVARAVGSADFQEGQRAVQEKRSPRFEGR